MRESILLETTFNKSRSSATFTTVHYYATFWPDRNKSQVVSCQAVTEGIRFIFAHLYVLCAQVVHYPSYMQMISCTIFLFTVMLVLPQGRTSQDCICLLCDVKIILAMHTMLDFSSSVRFLFQFLGFLAFMAFGAFYSAPRHTFNHENYSTPVGLAWFVPLYLCISCTKSSIGHKWLLWQPNFPHDISKTTSNNISIYGALSLTIFKKSSFVRNILEHCTN